MSSTQIPRVITRSHASLPRQLLVGFRSARHFHISTRLRTDGVFKELTEMRVRTPWVEALRKKQEEGIDPTKKSDVAATPSDRDLTPKRMADSYHRVVRLTAHM